MSRRAFLAGSAAVALSPLPLPAALCRAFPRGKLIRPVPSPSQLLWQQDELALFVHFGVNTFTNREWGDGREDPAIFNPSRLDCRQWARVARESGFRAMILTAKHHDGFCLWPSATTEHTVASSPWRAGQGDVVREFVDACRAEGLRVGLYCSPWDRNAPAYGDSSRYNDMYVEQLTELLTRYGAIHEMWFDGAMGEGPGGRRQAYDWPRFFGLVKGLQPEAVIFSDAGPDVRWIGNERGVAGDPNWSTMDPDAVPYPGADGEHVIRALQHGDPAGTVWRPGESDVSIRPGWFYHPGEDDRVKSAGDLMDIFFWSVGRNSKLLLNVPPAPDGLFHARDINRLREFRSRREAVFRADLASGRRAVWRATGPRTAVLEVAGEMRVGLADLREDIRLGQRVARYHLEGLVEGGWQTLSRGSTIGYRKLDRFSPGYVRGVRLTVEDAVEEPQPVTMSFHAGD